MSLAPAVKWVALALLGLAIAVGVAIAASNLTSQRIGISSESISAGDALAPGFSSARQKAKVGEKEGGQPSREPERGATSEGISPEESVPPSRESTAAESPPPPPSSEGGTGDSDDHGGVSDD